jgi:hypothetical protein
MLCEKRDFFCYVYNSQLIVDFTGVIFRFPALPRGGLPVPPPVPPAWKFLFLPGKTPGGTGRCRRSPVKNPVFCREIPLK